MLPCMFLIAITVSFVICQNTDDKFFCLKTQDDDWYPRIGFRCENNTCIRTFIDFESEPSACITSFSVCRLMCDAVASLVPLPSGKFQISDELVPIDVESITFFTTGSEEIPSLLEELENYFFQSEDIKNDVSNSSVDGIDMTVYLDVEMNNSVYSYQVDEGYILDIDTDDEYVAVYISGKTFFGIRHGIETLLQLIVYDEISKSILMPADAYIEDSPAYKHRGVLLDTSRSYFSTSVIKKMLSEMARYKLNTFHWHITDSQSFPFLSIVYPELAYYGAYSHSQVYTWDDIQDIVEYARIRGIRVLPEFDLPSHVGEGWQFFEDDEMILCLNKEPRNRYCVDEPCGIVNPLSHSLYEVLQDLFQEFNSLFESDIFHMGGDEVMFNCWNETKLIQKWMKKRHMKGTDEDFFKLWSMFQAKAERLLHRTAPKHKKPRIVLWTSSLTESKNVRRYLDNKEHIIQVWTKGRDPHIAHLLNNGYDLILSNYDALYFDCGFGAQNSFGNNWCSPYIGWQKVYSNDPNQLLDYFRLNNYTIPETASAQILGAEATIWSEQIDSVTLDSRLWPRGIAMAERLWTNPSAEWTTFKSRLMYHREKMVARGTAADSIDTRWCLENGDRCY